MPLPERVSVPAPCFSSEPVPTRLAAAVMLKNAWRTQEAAVADMGEFDVPARFDTDTLGLRLDAFEIGAIPDIPVLEIRE